MDHRTLPLQAQKSMDEYLRRIEQYMQKNHIDNSLYSDLTERIDEKLNEIQEDITQKHVITIIAELGEPEDIFSSVEGNPPNVFEKGYQWISDRQGSLKKYSTSLSLQPSQSNAIKQSIRSIYLSLMSILEYLLTAIQWILERVAHGIGSLAKHTPQTLFRIIKKIAYLGLSLLCIFGAGALIIPGAISLIQPVLHNQILLYDVHPWLQWGLFGMFTTLCIGSLSALQKLFGKTLLPSFLISVSIIIFCISFYITVTGIGSVIANHSNTYVQSWEHTFDIVNSPVTFSGMNTKEISELFFPALFPHNIILKTHTKENVHVITEAVIHTKNEETKERIFSQLTPPSFSQTENTLNIQTTKTPPFMQAVPFGFLHYNVIITVPEALVFNIERRPLIDIQHFSSFDPSTKKYCGWNQIRYNNLGFHCSSL